jgi:hypothetical protein
LPKRRSATMLPSSWPGKYASRTAGPPLPTSAGSIATPPLSLSTSAVFTGIDGDAAMTALIMATLWLFLAGLVPATVAIVRLVGVPVEVVAVRHPGRAGGVGDGRAVCALLGDGARHQHDGVCPSASSGW